MSIEQWANAVPPRKGACLALTLDATARAYSLTSLKLGGFTPAAANVQSIYVYLQRQADGADCYVQFASDNTVTLNDATAIAAGDPLAFANTYCQKIPDGSTVGVRIDRKLDTHMHVKGSGAGTLRINATSEAL
jgi:hypothetical protein